MTDGEQFYKRLSLWLSHAACLFFGLGFASWAHAGLGQAQIAGATAFAIVAIGARAIAPLFKE